MVFEHWIRFGFKLGGGDKNEILCYKFLLEIVLMFKKQRTLFILDQKVAIWANIHFSESCHKWPYPKSLNILQVHYLNKLKDVML